MALSGAIEYPASAFEVGPARIPLRIPTVRSSSRVENRSRFDFIGTSEFMTDADGELR